jgi:DNA-binding transcriptional MerR regulator
VSTGDAARELGVNIRTLQRWVEAGLIEPDLTTAGGHMRWDLPRLRDELRRIQRERRER